MFALSALGAFAALPPAPPAAAQTAPAPAAPAPIEADWHDIPDSEILVITLSGGRQVFVRLAPRYAPGHVANIRRLAAEGWWDGTAIYRAQDNYVAQWGDPTDAKPLPPLVIENPPAEYEWPQYDGVAGMSRPDPYAPRTGFSADGWPLGTDGKASWLTHCYGMVGVARDNPPSTGSGAALYAVIGHAPRHLDRNIALVGRVIQGIDLLSTLPRGREALGLYSTAAEQTPILSVRLASQLPEDERPRFQYRATDNPRFAAFIAARENRAEAFFVRPAGGADICNVDPGVRRLR
ncbi:peptidylprolyl isomerase [Sphingomonas canadensis]|uniref:peptidylprolyl isomerase n=2 Tax=Sphingomonas canadensis TaxID=1219257 RepID=A0ABW3H0U2_9SPHN|nr:peptidylprolyl isomerase [Sphingomonas canadensis]MCW3835013.1 peptidylprolyl isomerase [Sphingomonas canadensis]